MLQKLSRRSMITAGATGFVSAIFHAMDASAATTPNATSSTITMWQLNPDWGTPLTTSTGATRTRCKGRACHSAAPNRFFLTEADALAGRIHPCCLAQPVKVAIDIDLNALMPYYQARLGGVDLRCPDLPPSIVAALKGAKAPTTTTTTTTTTPQPGTTPSSTPATTKPDGSGVQGKSAGNEQATPNSLAFTGSTPTALLLGGAAVLAGIGLTAAAHTPDTEIAVEDPPTQDN